MQYYLTRSDRDFGIGLLNIIIYRVPMYRRTGGTVNHLSLPPTLSAAPKPNGGRCKRGIHNTIALS